MEFQAVVNQRKMIRSFKEKPVPPEILDIILENIFSGPSAGFSQGTEVLVLNTEEDRERFYSQWGDQQSRRESFTRWPKMENAPVIIIVCANKTAYLDRYAEPDKGHTDRDESRWTAPYWFIDAGMAALLGLLTVVDRDLGAVFTGLNDIEYVKQEFSIPAKFHPIGAISIGYPENYDPPSPSLKRGRRPLSEVVHYNTWEPK